ncbi:MAG: hypothetical protein AAF823_05415 [Planctomycetota bacterium]
MQVETFFAHHGIRDNPFAAEEARLDPVLSRLPRDQAAHPELPKVLGQIDSPSTSVVFGEKGTGKTALRLHIAHLIDGHNRDQPARRVACVAYDDLNPVLDRLLRHHRQDRDRLLRAFRLEDHQDAILSAATTKLVDAALGDAHATPDNPPILLPESDRRSLRKRLGSDGRRDLLILAALYDAPPGGSGFDRFISLRKRLGSGSSLALPAAYTLAILLAIAAAVLAIGAWLTAPADRPWWLMPALGVAGAGAIVCGVFWGWTQLRCWWLAGRIDRETPAVERVAGSLRRALTTFRSSTLAKEPLPTATIARDEASDARYQLTRKLVEVLARLDHAGLTVLLDRLDEPTLIAGDAEKMKAVIWPLFDNKFLKQDRVGLKLLLPIELRFMLNKEDPDFFQRARLDKQSMIDRLAWSGTTLYDLCSRRLQACLGPGSKVALVDLFEDDVSTQMLIDALDQMQQPRDAFKFLYRVVREHCRLVPEDAPTFRIPRLTLETVRRDEARRVDEFFRGFAPA